MENKSVSSVIGVMLMVMLTVILASIIGIYVLELPSNIEGEAKATIDIREIEKESIEAAVQSRGNTHKLYVKTNKDVKWNNKEYNGGYRNVNLGDRIKINNLSTNDQVVFIGKTENSRNGNVVRIYTHRE